MLLFHHPNPRYKGIMLKRIVKSFIYMTGSLILFIAAILALFKKEERHKWVPHRRKKRRRHFF